MDIHFTPSGQTEKLLHDKLFENPSGTLPGLISAICETVFATDFLPLDLLVSSLEALDSQLSQFESALKDVKFDNSFTPKEEKVIQAAHNGLYGDHDVEGAFYEHGGYGGIITLILFFRNSDKIQKQWSAIAEGFRGWLVKRVAKMLRRDIVEWIPQFIRTRSWQDPYPLQYLGQHAGRKRKKHTNKAESLSIPRNTSDTFPQHQQQGTRQIERPGASPPQNHPEFQSRLISSSGQDLSQQPRMPSSPHQRDQQDFQFSKYIPNVSSPSKDRVSITQQQDAQRFQHIPTSRSNKSPAHVLVPSITSIAHTSLSIDSLPVLLYSLGCYRIRQDILFRGLLPQKRWNDRGNVQEITLYDAGFHEQVACLFSSHTKLEQNIKSCIQLGSIVQNVLADGSLACSISDKSRHQISQSFKREELHLLGLMFTTHIYPRDQALEPSFQGLGKLLLPHLECTWQYIQGEPRLTLPAHVRNSFVEASIASCTLIGTSRAEDVISVLAKFQDPDLPAHLRMAITNRESISLRFKGDHDRSDVVIQDILESIALDSTDIRSYCSYGRLLLSRTENAILRKDFDKAASYLASWEVKNMPPSGLELQVVRLKNTVIGRVSRYEGKFEHARYCLEECLKTIPGAASRFHVMHHLADVYCELKIPWEVENLVLDEVKALRARGQQRSISFRRLVLPLAEAYIERRMLEAAETVLRELLNIFDGIVNHNIADQLGHVRSVIGLARVDWYEGRRSETRQSLERALILTEKYKTFSKRNFYIGVIYLFLSIVNFELHMYSESQSTFASANDILYEQVPRHFMPGMGSYFLEHLWRSARSLKWPSAS